MANYIIVNADKIQQKIDELKKPIAHYDGIYVSDEQTAQQYLLEELLDELSIPLIPEIENAFDAGIRYGEDLQGNYNIINMNSYISQLKLDI